MTRQDEELDDFAKRTLAPLRTAPPLDPELASVERKKFLEHAVSLRKDVLPHIAGKPSERPTRSLIASTRSLRFPIFKALAITILVMILVAASSLTVYAAQGSLPGEPLYSIKSASEDIRLSMTVSPQARLNLTLDFTNRRMSEIESLVSEGKLLTDYASLRFQSELDEALQLAADMNDQQMVTALIQIKNHAGKQGMTLQELISSLPSQASPAIIRLQQRLQEQVQLSVIGEGNPQEFRNEVQERAQNRRGPKVSPNSDETGEAPVLATAEPVTTQGMNQNGGGMAQPTDSKGNGNEGNGQGQPGQGNGNHGQKPTHTPNP
jgi:hypothetical protein